MQFRECHIHAGGTDLTLDDGSDIIDQIKADGRNKGDATIPIRGKDYKVDWDLTHGGKLDINVKPV